MKVSIVIAAYNEAQKIESVIRDLQRNGYRDIIVVDDCSKDETSLVAKKAHATVLRHIINRGQGAALKTGIAYALAQRAEIIITFDADGQHQAKDIRNLIAPIVQGEVEVTLGSRFLEKNETIPFFRSLVLFVGRIFLRVMYNARLSDSQSGLRALSRSAASRISFSADRMEHCVEIISEIHTKKISFVEVPIHVLYTEYSKKKGQSGLNSINIALKMLLKKFME